MSVNKKILGILSIALYYLLTLSEKARAAGFLDEAFGDDSECLSRGKCTLDEVAAGFISLIRVLLGGIGAIALVFLVWGGVQWVWSGGNADKLRKGKDIFFNTMAALVLAFGSYMITSFFINDILQPENDYQVQSDGNTSLNECRNQAIETPCNTLELNYVCSGPDYGESCVTKCQLQNYTNQASIDEGYAWRCDTVDNFPEGFYAENLCPGDTSHRCFLFGPTGVVLYQDVLRGLVGPF